MTNQQGAPEALDQLFEKLEDCIYEWSNYVRADDAPTTLPKYTAGAIKDLRTAVKTLHAALVEAQQPAPSAQAASSAVLKAIREANMQLVRTGDDAFMLFPYKVATPQADSAPAEAVQRIVHLRADRERRVYVAGPMTGLPEYNFPLFNATAARLRSEGWHVENPAEHGHVDGAGWSDYLRWDISRIATCGAIYLLPGWSKSKGATLEVHIAGVLGLQVLLADGAEAPQADSQPAPADVEDAIAWLVTWKGGEHTYAHAHASELPAVNQARMMGGTVTPCVAARAPADSVLEDAARLDWLDQQREAYGFQDIHEGNRWEISGAYANVREAIDAARKQGANHD